MINFGIAILESEVEMKTSEILSVYLGVELKRRWINYCKAQQVKPSAGMRQIAMKLTQPRSGFVTATYTELPNELDSSSARVEIRLRESELNALKQIAEITGYGINRYVADLVRAHLLNRPQLGQFELDAVTHSNAQLMKIGSILNQIARAINRNPLDTDLARVELINDVSRQIKAHAHSVAMLIQANLQRWKVK